MPSWVKPDLLTAIGVIGALLTGIGYAASGSDLAWLNLAIAGYVINWFGDSMDGSLARFRKIERPSFGYFIDHSCDGLATLLILGGMGLSPFLRMDIALLALTGYLLLSIHAFLSAKVLGELRLSYFALGPTELRMALIALTVAMILAGSPRPAADRMSGFDLVLGAAAGVMVLLFIIQTLLTGRRLARMAE